MGSRKSRLWPALLLSLATLALVGCGPADEEEAATGGAGGGSAGTGGVAGSGGTEEPGEGGTGGTEEPGEGGTGGTEEPGEGGTGGTEEPGEGGTGGTEEPGEGGTGGTEEPGEGGTGGTEEPGEGGTGGTEEPGEGGSGGTEEPGEGGTGGTEEPGEGGTGGTEEPGEGGSGGTEEPSEGGSGGTEEPGEGGSGGTEEPTGPNGVTAMECMQTCGRIIEGCGSARFGDRFACEDWCFQELTPEQANCLTSSQCTGAEVESCLENTDVGCAEMCEHVYGCGFTYDDQRSIDFCHELCIGDGFSETEIDCTLNATCNLPSMLACDESEPPPGDCRDMCDFVYSCDWSVGGGSPISVCYDFCDGGDVYSEEAVACVLGLNSCDLPAAQECLWEPPCDGPGDQSAACLQCEQDQLVECFDSGDFCDDEWFPFLFCLQDWWCSSYECGILFCPEEWAAVASCSEPFCADAINSCQP